MSNSSGQSGFYTTGVSNAAPRAVRGRRGAACSSASCTPGIPADLQQQDLQLELGDPTVAQTLGTRAAPHDPTRSDHSLVNANIAAIRSPEGRPKRATRLLRMRELEKRIGLKKSSIYARLSKTSKYRDDTFPRPASLTPNSGPTCRRKAAIAFSEDEVEIWLAARLSERTTD